MEEEYSLTDEEFEQDEDEIISEAAEYSPKSEFSKPKLVYTAMEKCINARGKEMKAGYYNIKLSKEGAPMKIWIEDSRQVFAGTVMAVKTILSPEIKLNPDYRKVIEKHISKIKEIKNKYVYEEKKLVNNDGVMLWIKNGMRYIPEIGTKVIMGDVENPENATSTIGGWDNYTNCYWNETVEIYDKILETLNDLINKLNYFKVGIRF